jgi:hypothetical protein
MPFYFYTIMRFTRFRFTGAMFTRHPLRFADHARVTTDYAQVSTCHARVMQRQRFLHILHIASERLKIIFVLNYYLI